MIVTAQNGYLVIDNDHFGVKPGALAGKSGVEVGRFEMFDDGDVVGQGVALKEIGIE